MLEPYADSRAAICCCPPNALNTSPSPPLPQAATLVRLNLKIHPVPPEAETFKNHPAFPKTVP